MAKTISLVLLDRTLDLQETYDNAGNIMLCGDAFFQGAPGGGRLPVCVDPNDASVKLASSDLTAVQLEWQIGLTMDQHHHVADVMAQIETAYGHHKGGFPNGLLRRHLFTWPQFALLALHLPAFRGTGRFVSNGKGVFLAHTRGEANTSRDKLLTRFNSFSVAPNSAMVTVSYVPSKASEFLNVNDGALRDAAHKSVYDLLHAQSTWTNVHQQLAAEKSQEDLRLAVWF